MLVEEVLAGAAADDVVVDAELPRDVFADPGGEDRARDVELAAFGAAVAGTIDYGVVGSEKGGEVSGGGGDEVPAEEGDA